MANEFAKALKGVDSAIKVGTSRALNRAIKSAKSQIVKQIRDETGLKTDDINTRMRSKKSTVADLSVILGIATKFGIGLRKFAPLLKKVQARYKDGTTRQRTGVTVKIGDIARSLVPGAFVLDNAKGLFVVGRKAAYDADGNYIDPSVQSKLTELKTTIFSDVAKAHEAETQKKLVDTFNENVTHEIDFAVQSKFDSNK